MANFEPISGMPDDPYSYGFPFLLPEFGHEIFYDMARASRAMGDPDRALALCQQSIERNDWALPYILRGNILAERGELAAAREQYLMALDRADNEELVNHINNLLAELSG